MEFNYYDPTTATRYITQSQSPANPIKVTGNGSDSVNATLVPGASISGTVTGALGSGAFDICVDVYPSGSSPSAAFTGQSFPVPSGANYTVSGLPAGSYDVEFDPTCAGGCNPGYPAQYYDSSAAPSNPTSSSSATAVTVGTGGSATGIDDQLAPSSTAPPAPPPPLPATRAHPGPTPPPLTGVSRPAPRGPAASPSPSTAPTRSAPRRSPRRGRISTCRSHPATPSPSW